MDNKTLVIYEGQQHWIDPTIASHDDLLRQVFTPLCPELAHARIERRDGQVHLIRQAKTKGSRAACAVLADAPCQVNPALLLCRQLQQQELCQGMTTHDAAHQAQAIAAAITAGQEWHQHYRQSLRTLQQAEASPSVLVTGF